ncbi:hypothetical protein BsIDN1_07570 [Bacillus safensis]|uniref:Solute-binding protein family 3/N-terminal domain-containing protein n=1 Tax=Bacillus safensis TaxID=561879 RepID=A0A5S9M5F2_BACIA|nr:hypothetical protein BsIDN1_07570 [Bacillus safensis]
MLMSTGAVYYLLKLKKTGLPLKIVGNPIVYEEVGYPFAKDKKHDKLREEFNKAIKELREDGTLKKLSEKYFKDDVTVPKKNNDSGGEEQT